MILMLIGTGCHNTGPKSITRDRWLYSDAISRSWQDQMLLNMVKLRYGDAMIFVDITSIINQYSVAGEVRVNAQDDFSGGGFVNAGTTGRYEDRPTISYAPMTGEKFSRSMLTPMRPASLLALVQAGWRVDYVFDIAVQSVNGVSNRASAAMFGRDEDPEFLELLNLLHDMQMASCLSLRVNARPEGEAVTMRFHVVGNAEIERKLTRVREILHLNPEAVEFDVVYGAVPENDAQIAILSRSITEIVLELAYDVDIPQVHIDEGRAMPTTHDLSVPPSERPLQMRVHSQQDEPMDAQVKIHYRGYWFWIDDRDLQSKRVFTFLIFLVSMAEGADVNAGPAVTISAGS